jgi:hypothetical protein
MSSRIQLLGALAFAAVVTASPVDAQPVKNRISVMVGSLATTSPAA